ncbi:MAG: oligopeptide:H+ symporter [Legionellaceae bacterium]|nr:oligopeptide:H+ symporter [Legionellaceae bacterium]
MFFQKHPKTLLIFFGTEMWERYGFYVLQSLLALYLALHYHWSDARVYELVGAFTALTYLSPIVGGWIADNLLGQRISILLGTVCLFLSYVSLVLWDNEALLPYILAGTAAGTGLLKANISSLLGHEYKKGAGSREAGFTIFYMGITSGIILGTTLPSYIEQLFGWSATFLSAAFGIILAAGIFTYGMLRYHINDYYEHHINYKHLLCALLITVGFYIAAVAILQYPEYADIAFILIVSAATLYIARSITLASKAQARQNAAIGILCIISVLFWAFYFQMFLSLTLFIDRVVEPTLFGISFPAPAYVSLQSIGMLILGAFLARRPAHALPVEAAIHSGKKFTWAMFTMSIAYALIVCVAHVPSTHLLSPLLLIPSYLCISLAELLLSPVGLCAVTILASPENVSTMMGIFFISLSLGGFLSGKLAALTSLSAQQMTLPWMQIKMQYAHTFMELFCILVVATLLSFLLLRILTPLMRKT